uniref:Uncharacterized protein n=1 Tax=Arundo donax TaxID=35708 RepID=A0A0A9A9F8_ARUDO
MPPRVLLHPSALPFSVSLSYQHLLFSALYQ